MDTSKNINEFSVTIYGNLDKYNDVLSKARCRIFYKGINRNGSYISDEFAEKLLSTIRYAPIKGIYADDDYSDHGLKRSMGRIYGIVPEDPHVAWEQHEDEDGVIREYACVDVLRDTASAVGHGDAVARESGRRTVDVGKCVQRLVVCKRAVHSGVTVCHHADAGAPQRAVAVEDTSVQTALARRRAEV